MIWKGKAYRVRLYKKYNKFTLNFNYSHWYKLIFNKNRYKINKVNRQNYLFIFIYSLNENILKLPGCECNYKHSIL